MKIRALKAQNIVELGIVSGLILMMIFVAFTPIGDKITSIFKHTSPQIDSSISQTDLAGLVSEDNYNKLSESLNKLSESSNPEVQNLVNDIKSLVKTVGLINSNQAQNITEAELNDLTNQLAETSGSLASIIANIAEGVDLSTEEQAALNNIKSCLDSSVKINITNENLTKTVNDAVTGIVNSAGLAKEAFQYEGSPLQGVDLSSVDINSVVNEYFTMTGENAEKDTKNVRNMYLLTQNILNNYSSNISEELTALLKSIDSEIKKSIMVE